MTDSGPAWLPPTGWPPVPEPPAPTPTAGPRLSRGNGWLLCSCVAALLAIYLTVITYWLTIHTADRYQQAAPGAQVSTSVGDFELISLRRVSALPRSAGETATPKQGEGYVVAEVRMEVRDPELISVSCALELLGVDGSTWDYEYLSADDPRTADADYCDSVVVGRPATVTIGYALPATELDRIAGVVVTPGNGQRKPVLVPPG